MYYNYILYIVYTTDFSQKHKKNIFDPKRFEIYRCR